MLLKLMLIGMTAFFGREVIRTNQSDATWHAASTWDSGGLPSLDDRILIPGANNRSSDITIEAGRYARSAVMMVGRRPGSTGVLRINGRLRAQGPNVAPENQAGRIIVGGNTNADAWVIQSTGSDVVATDALVLGDVKNSVARYTVEGGRFKAVNAIEMAFDRSASAKFEVVGKQSSIETRELLMGDGDAELSFVPDDSGISNIRVTQAAELSGTIRFQLPTNVSARSRFKLLNLNNSATQNGGFRRVFIDTPGRHYELSYVGGNDNDVLVERRNQPLVRFETWKVELLSDPPTVSAGRPRSDADGDGLTNLGEYKFGTNPLINEGPAFDEWTDASGRPVMEFVERTDRTDVQTIVQTSLDGRVWSSENISLTTVSEFGNTRTVQAVADNFSPNLQFRVLFELLPDPGVPQNVLFITVDDLNDFIEPLGGHPQAITPNYNRLAARGTLFANAHGAATLCNASRIALLSGVRPSRSGAYANGTLLRDSPVLANARTIPEQFAANGYVSVGAGKIFHRSEPTVWSDYFPSLNNHRPLDPIPAGLPLSGVQGLPTQFDWGPISVRNADMGDHQVVTWTVNYMRSFTGQSPAFVGCGLFRPHLPFYVPQSFFSDWNTADIQLPLTIPNDLNDVPTSAFTSSMRDGDHDKIVAAGEWRSVIHAYLAAVRFSDYQLGRVLNALDDSPMARNTIIVLCSDHGWHLGEKRAWRKNTLWEESTRVPLIVIAPGVTTTRNTMRRSGQFARCLPDTYATHRLASAEYTRRRKPCSTTCGPDDTTAHPSAQHDKSVQPLGSQQGLSFVRIRRRQSRAIRPNHRPKRMVERDR